MLETFTASTFAGRIGETFGIRRGPSDVVQVQLVNVSELGSESTETERRATRRTPFSVLFQGPMEILLPQAIYRFEHHEMEPFELFIVPIGPAQGGLLYEAIFT